MALAFLFEDGFNAGGFGLGKSAGSGQRLETDAANLMPPAVDDGLAMGAVALALNVHTAREERRGVRVELSVLPTNGFAGNRTHAGD